jgi:lipopolysaccharide export system protein LptA
VLFDRWPKTAAKFKTTGPFSASVTFAKEKHKDYEFSAKDSTVFDKKGNVVHLYGKARLKNNKEELSADEIHYNLKTMQRVPRG